MRSEVERLITQISDIFGMENKRAKKERVLTAIAIVAGILLSVVAIGIVINKLINKEDDDFDEFLDDYYDEDTDEFFEDEEEETDLSSK